MERKESKTSDSLKYIEKKKLVNKGVQRMERHPSDGLSLNHLPKSGHGGKFTWEGPADPAEIELEAAPPAIDERDPNYVDEKEAEVEVFEDREGVARVEVHPPLLQP